MGKKPWFCNLSAYYKNAGNDRVREYLDELEDRTTPNDNQNDTNESATNESETKNETKKAKNPYYQETTGKHPGQYCLFPPVNKNNKDSQSDEDEIERGI